MAFFWCSQYIPQCVLLVLGILRVSPPTFLLFRLSLQAECAVGRIVCSLVRSGLRFLSFHFRSHIVGILSCQCETGGGSRSVNNALFSLIRAWTLAGGFLRTC